MDHKWIISERTLRKDKSWFGLYWKSVFHTVQEVTCAWYFQGIIIAIEFGLGCPAPRRTEAFWEVFRRKGHEEIKKHEKSLKELSLFSATKRKLLCNLAGCQCVIVVINVPDFHGSLIYWFANLPGWFRLDIEKTSCYHHETVARPPREARKPPSLGVATDKIDDALLGQSPRSVVAHCVCFVGPQVCALPHNREEWAAWPESGRVCGGRGWGRQDHRR